MEDESNPVSSRSGKLRLVRRARRTLAKRQKLDDLKVRIGLSGGISDSDNEGDDEISDASSEFLVGDEGSCETADVGMVDCACNGFADRNNGEGANVLDDTVSSTSEDPGVDDSETSDRRSDSDLDGDAAEGPGIHFNNNTERDMYLLASLRSWASSPGILSKRKVDELLSLLNPAFPVLPLSHATLLKHNENRMIRSLPLGGEFWYKGIAKTLDKFALREYLDKYGQITVDIGMDGLDVFGKSSLKFWPILGQLAFSKNAPFIIAIYFGHGDPKDLEDYLGDYVNEVVQLENNGYDYNGTSYPFVIRHYILDAPARQLVKQCKGHGGYSSCEKCTVVGVNIDGRRTFLDLDQPKRTDDSFRNRDDPNHHRAGDSPLARTKIGFVSQFRLDPMHLLYQGVMKRLLDWWLNAVGVWKLHQEIVTLISVLLDSIKDSCPSDFNRKPRGLKYFPNFKATELRRLLLYDGILVFKDLLDENIYRHFLLLHCAVFILSSSRLFPRMREEAEELLTSFVQYSATIYGEVFVVYNVHNLCHLVDECDLAGTLEEFSAFKFENALKSIKETVRSGYKPLQQVANKDALQSDQQLPIELSDALVTVQVSRRRKVQEENEVIAGVQYCKVSIGGVMLCSGTRDSYFQTKDCHLFSLSNVVCRRNKVYLIGSKFEQSEDFYNYPLPSSQLGIFSVWNLGQQKYAFSVADVLCKCWLVPDGAKFLCVPLLHTYNDIERATH